MNPLLLLCTLQLRLTMYPHSAAPQVKKGMSLTSVRKLAQGIAFVGPAACMIACAVLTPTSPAAAAIGKHSWRLLIGAMQRFL